MSPIHRRSLRVDDPLVGAEISRDEHGGSSVVGNVGLGEGRLRDIPLAQIHLERAPPDVGIGRIGHIEGLPHIRRDGRFLIVWKFDRGQGVIHPWFSVGTLSESAFPYAPGTSKRVIVTLGERTPVVINHHKARRKRAKKR